MNWKKLIILTLTTACCILAILVINCLYERTLSNSHVNVKVDSLVNIKFTDELPIWFSVNDSSGSYYFDSFKVMSDIDKKVLYSCIDANDSVKQTLEYQKVCQKIDELAYKSNTYYPNTQNLIWLTLCFVFLGCSARTFYNYIGWECYKEGCDMNKWWPWYVFRPIIGVPITAFLLVVFRTSLFSSLFTSKDLNHYIAISFIAGFAMMEFLTLLRRTAKGLFGDDKQ